VYPVTGELPVLVGGDHSTVTEAGPAVTAPSSAAPGAVTGTLGVTEPLRADAGLVPTALVAVTVNVYAVPLTNPGTVTEVAPVVEAVIPPGLAVTVYPLTGLPLATAAPQLTVALPSPALAATDRGAPGTAVGVTAALRTEAGPGPTALAAVTANV
jgi:hypothetical protein